MLRAFQCSTVGYYSEALTFLKSVNKNQLDSVGLRNYYMTQMHVYGELGYYSKILSMQSGYYKNRSLYRDSLFLEDPFHAEWLLSEPFTLSRLALCDCQSRQPSLLYEQDLSAAGAEPHGRSARNLRQMASAGYAREP